MNLLKLIAVDN